MDFSTFLSQTNRGPAVLVTVLRAQGSVPREAGAWMIVGPFQQVGTVGGGNLEWDAAQQCRDHMRCEPQDAARAWTQRIALGPSLGQCCGGAVELGFERIDAVDRDVLAQRLVAINAPVALFGGGHVGRAIVKALEPLPFRVRWVDSRDEVFPTGLSEHVDAEHSDPVHAAVHDLVVDTSVLIMSFSHAEDLDTVAACLARMRERNDLPFVGLIGSQTKWATFRRRLIERGFSESELARITSPIGLPGITGKEPAVIAASVVAQLLQRRHGP